MAGNEWREMRTPWWCPKPSLAGPSPTDSCSPGFQADFVYQILATGFLAPDSQLRDWVSLQGHQSPWALGSPGPRSSVKGSCKPGLIAHWPPLLPAEDLTALEIHHLCPQVSLVWMQGWCARVVCEVGEVANEQTQPREEGRG